MAEPTVIQEQRELLRAFREATARRTKAETEAKARLEQEQKVVNAALEQAAHQRTQAEANAKARFERELEIAEAARSQNIKGVTDKLKTIEPVTKGAKLELARVGMNSVLDRALEQPPLHPPETFNRDTLVELNDYMAQFPSIERELQQSVSDLQIWRNKQATRRRLFP